MRYFLVGSRFRFQLELVTIKMSKIRLFIKPLSLLLFSFCVSWLLTRPSFETLGTQLNNSVNDLMAATLPHPFPSDQVVVLGLMTAEDGGYLLDRRYSQLKSLLQEILARHPKVVISAFPLPVLNANESEMREFVDYASKIDNLHFYSYWTAFDPESLIHHPVLGSLHHLFLPLTKDQDRNTVRRTIVQMIMEDGSWIDNPLFGVLKEAGISRTPKEYSMFEYLDSFQVFTRYRPFENLQLVPIHQIKTNGDLIRDKIVVVGHGYETEDPLYRAKSVYSFIKEFGVGDLTAAQRIGLDLNVLIKRDPLTKLTASEKFLLVFVFISLYAFGISYLPVVFGFVWGLVMIPFWLLATVIAYLLFSTLISMGLVALVIFLIHFVASSFLMTRYLRGKDKEAAEAERRLEIQRLQSEILVKSARADQGLKIAMQVAHDIRSPLSGIRIVAQKTRTEIRPELSQLIFDCVGRMQAIADDLLRKFRNDDFSEEKVDVILNLFDFFNQIVSGYASSLSQLKFHLKGDRDLCITLNYRTEFERAICNLLNNSIEAGANNIDVHIGGDSQRISLHIRDNGPGVPSEHVARIFERGVTFGKREGTGLGLAQVSETVQQMGGTIRYIKESEGAHFVLEIPGDERKGETLSIFKRVVIVEDNESVRGRWQRKLNEAGASLTLLSRPEEFFEIAIKEPFTLITDLIFDNSELTGFKVLEESRRYKCQRILCSSLAGNTDIQRMASGIADKVLTKTQFERLVVTLVEAT